MNTELVTTPDERQIAALLLQGWNGSEIADQLKTSTAAVKNHLRTIYSRAGIKQGVKRVKLIKILSESADKAALPDCLTVSERRVAELTIAGDSNPEIAQQINVSVQMVKNYLRVVFDKCGVWSRTELAARFRCA